MSNWKTKFINDHLQEYESKYFVDNVPIYCLNFENSESYDFHKNHTNGAHLRELGKQKYHQIYWESPYYKKTLDKFLRGTELQNSLILDFGCGDGRFTDYLLDNKADKIICIDFDLNTLISLSHFINENVFSEKVILIHGDYDSIPFNKPIFDLILSIGVLYYLNNRYLDSLKCFKNLLSTDGILITSDPQLESFILRALIFDNLDVATQTFKSKCFKETKQDSGFKFRAFDETEWLILFREAKLKVLGKQNISFFHNLIRVLYLRGIITKSDLDRNNQAIWEMFDYLHEHGNLAKHVVWKLTS
jgi:SAM-dependent methyltransferase